MTDLADIVSSAFWRVNAPDADPQETREWLDAFDALVESEGRQRAHVLLRKPVDHAGARPEGRWRAASVRRKLMDHARARRVARPPVLNTPYKNSVTLAEQPQFP